jgi:hypothetical protein
VDSAIFKNKLTYIILAFYCIVVLWWIKIFLSGSRETDENYLFGSVYASIALVGGLYGLAISKKWGGYKSLVGRGTMFLALGLFGQWFGQTVWSYYNIVAHVEVPYPSIADIGYFSIIPLYALGMFSFAKASGALLTLRTAKGKLNASLVLVAMVLISYFLFLKNLTPDLSQPLRTFLDFGYPFGEAITITIALLTYTLSKGLLGGKMKSRVLYLIFALIVQYVTDYTFLYKASAETYYNAGPVDLMYATSFTAMAIGLIALSKLEE